MATLRTYRRKSSATVIAVRLDLETDGFTYEKWGATQTCKPGDWLVNNAGDTYTVDGETFARTYSRVSDGIYEKVIEVWAERADDAGVIQTKEGATQYHAGDMLVYNGANRTDGYAMAADKFALLYEPS